MNKKEIINLITGVYGQANNLTMPRLLIKRLNKDHTCALFLSQLIYWHDKTKDINGWIYKTYEDWEEELCLSKKQVMRIKDKLISLHLIETTVKKVNEKTTLHYRCLMDNIISFILDEKNNQAPEESENNDDKETTDEDNKDKTKSNETITSENPVNSNNQEVETQNEPPKIIEEISAAEVFQDNFEKCPKVTSGSNQRELREVPKGNFEKCQKVTSGSNQRELPTITKTTSIDYLHRLHTNLTNQEKNTLSPSNPNQENFKDFEISKESCLIFYNYFKIANKNIKKADLIIMINSLFKLSCESEIYQKNNFNAFIQNFTDGVKNLKWVKIYVSETEFIDSYKNYLKIMTLQKEKQTWWKSPGDLETFCNKKIFQRFTTDRFDINIYIRPREPSEPARLNLVHNKYNKNDELPF